MNYITLLFLLSSFCVARIYADPSEKPSEHSIHNSAAEQNSDQIIPAMMADTHRNVAQQAQRQARIIPQHVALAIRNDAELNELFQRLQPSE